MAIFLRRFTTSSASLASRPNVFVSAKKKPVVLAPIHSRLSSTLPSIQKLPAALCSNFLTTKFQEQHAISVSLLLASMDLGMRGAISIESSRGCV
jgi:hypothetical protein